MSPTRRTLIRTALTAGAAVPLLSACVTGGDNHADPPARDTGNKRAQNPPGGKVENGKGHDRSPVTDQPRSLASL